MSDKETVQPMPMQGIERIDVGSADRLLLVAGSAEAIDIVREMMRVYKALLAGRKFGLTPDGCLVERGGPRR